MAVDVLIGQAYFLRFDPTLWAASQPYAPLGALYAAAVAREAGYEVALFDAMLASSVDEWDTALEQHDPAVAVIYEDSFNYLSKMCLLRMRSAALLMIAAARRRRIPVIVAGSDATDHPALYLDQGARAIIAGEGEVTLVRLLDALRDRQPCLDAIEGIVLAADGQIVRTPPRPIVRELDSLPRPAWDLVDIERYRRAWRQKHGYFSMNVATTRGCPYHCNWCAKPIYGQRYNARSPEHVADEIAWLRHAYAPDHLWITDDIFGLKPGWIARFARALKERDAVTPFKCLMRADGIDRTIVEALVASGCKTVWIGAESGSQHVLDAMEKGTRVEQIEAAATQLRASGIEVGFFLQFGYPGETAADINATLAMVDRCDPDDIGVSVSYPLPGTPFFERVRSQLGDKQNWVDSSDLAMMYHGTYSPMFYRALHRFTHVGFRARKGWSTLKRAARTGGVLEERSLTAAMWSVACGCLLPLLRVRMWYLRRTPVQRERAPAIVPVLTRRAAALPTEQSH